jgi:hypothetical protein
VPPARAPLEPVAPAAPAVLAVPEPALDDDELGAEGVEPAGALAEPPLTAVFDRLRGFAQGANRGLFAALDGGEIVTRSEETLRIRLPSAIAVRRLEARSAELAAVVERFFGKPLRVVLEAASAPSQPGKRAAGPDPVAQRRRQEALNHPAVNEALEILSGEILEIRPLGGERP